MIKVLIFVLFFIILGLIYFLGLIPKTPTFYEKRFNDFYLGLLSANSCDEILFWLDYQEDPGFINYVQQNDLWIQKKYPRHLLAENVNKYDCIDKYGNKVLF